MLEVKGLVKKYGDKTAINGLDFHIGKGEIVGLLGLNGAGKSTTMNCITGYIAPTAGSVTVNGFDIIKDARRAKSVIGYLPEIFSFYSDMKVNEYLDFVCDLKGLAGSRQARKKHIEEICGKTGIAHLSGRMIRNLSKGYKQRVGFAQALIGNPQVLILDEPTVGLDPSQIIEIRQLIKDISRDCTVIISSHILSEIQAICSRIIVIHEGRIAADADPSSLMLLDENRVLLVRAKADAKEIEAVLERLPDIEHFTKTQGQEEGACDYQITAKQGADIREQVFQAFAQAGIALIRLSSRQATLENTFLHLTGNDIQAEQLPDRKEA